MENSLSLNLRLSMNLGLSMVKIINPSWIFTVLN